MRAGAENTMGLKSPRKLKTSLQQSLAFVISVVILAFRIPASPDLIQFLPPTFLYVKLHLFRLDWIRRY